MRKEAKHTEGPCAVFCPECNSKTKFTFVVDSQDIFRLWCTSCSWANNAELSREQSRIERAKRRLHAQLQILKQQEEQLADETSTQQE